MNETKRLRIFAGPNGSGKSTIINIVRDQGIDLGIFVNADDIKVSFDSEGYVDFTSYNIIVSKMEIEDKLKNSFFFPDSQSDEIIAHLTLTNNKLSLHDLSFSDILSTFIADFIRSRLLGTCNKFTFETVMSHPSKLEYIKQARLTGYKTYLYFVALEDPFLNIERVEARVLQNGHDVPKDKIISRYYRTMNSLLDAIRIVDKAYFFDNSSSNSNLFGIYENGEINITKPDQIPEWFYTYVLNKLESVK